MRKATLKVGFITTVSGRWPRELPKQRDEIYSEYLKNTYPDVEVVKYETIAVDNNDIKSATKYFNQNRVDLIVMVMGAFTGDFASTYLAERVGVPIVLWTPFEPPFDGGRLMSNALVASTMNMAAVKRLGHKCYFVYGDHDTKRAQDEIDKIIKAHKCKKSLANISLGLVGYRPTAFYSSAFDETVIRNTFGVIMEETDIAELMELANSIDQEKVDADMAKLQSSVTKTCLPEGHLENHCRLKLGMQRLIDNHAYDAISLKCWPELGNMKCTPCGMISRFSDEDFIIGCENDVDATITMVIQKLMTDDIPFMTDLIKVDEEKNTVLFWHCGQAGRKIMNCNCDIEMNDHPLAGQGVAFEGTLQTGTITIARMTYLDGKYKLFLAKGEALETEKSTKGVMGEVKIDGNAMDMVYQICQEGIPHHYSIIWQDIYNEMKEFCDLLDIEVIEVK